MTNTIALCGIEDEISRTLEGYGEYRILRFFDEPERRGDVKLAYFLRDGPPVALAVVGYPGAKGLPPALSANAELGAAYPVVVQSYGIRTGSKAAWRKLLQHRPAIPWAPCRKAAQCQSPDGCRIGCLSRRISKRRSEKTNNKAMPLEKKGIEQWRSIWK